MASASGKFADDAHEDRQDAGDQRGDDRDGGEPRAGRGAAAEVLAVRVGDAGEDDRVEDDDVGHRQERDDAATHLLDDGRVTFADLEVGVESEGHARSMPELNR